MKFKCTYVVNMVVIVYLNWNIAFFSILEKVKIIHIQYAKYEQFVIFKTYCFIFDNIILRENAKLVHFAVFYNAKFKFFFGAADLSFLVKIQYLYASCLTNFDFAILLNALRQKLLINFTNVSVWVDNNPW